MMSERLIGQFHSSIARRRSIQSMERRMFDEFFRRTWETELK